MLDTANPLWSQLPAPVRRAVLDTVMALAANEHVDLWTYRGAPCVFVPRCQTDAERAALAGAGFTPAGTGFVWYGYRCA